MESLQLGSICHCQSDDEKNVEEDEKLSPDLDLKSNESMDVDSGCFKVEAILKHKYKQGWRFLTKWEGWPLSDATWEPVKSFVDPGGPINAAFLEYCQSNGLERPLREAIQRSSRESDAQGHGSED